uniref:Subtilisin-like protease SBT2.4 n=1 Tax=Kalanchoe fedtschenkoi TaxID=63787 RepID=A0A7N0UJT0_KALFE
MRGELLLLAAFLLVSTVEGALSNGEADSMYLVVMEAEPLAFFQSSSDSVKEAGERVDTNSEASKAHAASLLNSHHRLLQSTLDNGTYTKLYSFHHIINGFSVKTSPAQITKLAGARGVKLVEKDSGVRLTTTYTPDYLGLPRGVWASEGGPRHAGEGVVVGIVDTGIDPLHPSFGFDPLNPYATNGSRFVGACEEGPWFPAASCNGKIVGARFFAAGAQAAAKLNASIDLLSPLDVVGHGSHVASVAAGNHGVPVIVNGYFYGRASGMAPRARIAVYKAVYPTIGTLTDVVAAIEQAVIDGVDILTLSVGPDEPPEDSVTFLGLFDLVMLNARRAGVFVVQAAGNNGPGPYTVVSYSPWAVGVAASNTDRIYPGTLVLGNGQKIAGVGLSGETFGNELIKYKLVLAKDGLRENGSFPQTPEYVEECQHPEAFDPFIVQGSIMLCTFSAGFVNQTSTLSAIIQTAKAVGLAGFVLLANPSLGDYVAEPVPFSVPAVLIPNVSDSQSIMQYYESQTLRKPKRILTRFGAKAGIGEGRVACFAGRAPVVSRFSSRGPDFINSSRFPADVLKPDIMAPGHQIWGAWSPKSVSDPILSGQSFALLSGTSMAAPHVAGVAALIKQCNPSWTPSMIASAMATTANKYDNLGDQIMAEGYQIDSLQPSAPFGFGAGQINPARALDPGLVISPEYEDYISFLCSLPNINPVTIKAATGGACNKSLGSPTPSDLNLPSLTLTSLRGSHTVRRIVKNVGDRHETYLCSALSPNGTAVSISPPVFTVQPGGLQELNIKLIVTQPMRRYTFGEIVLTGTLDHIVRIPLSVVPVSRI